MDVATPPLRLDPERALAGLVWSEVFGRVAPVEVEVGIGKGRFLLAAAASRPDVDHLGIEWANEYLRIAETRAGKRGLRNVRFVRADAKDLVARAIPETSVAAYYVFYPDPWPKKRHQKRRLVSAATLGELARIMRPGAELRIATDIGDYARWILLAVREQHSFGWSVEGPRDWRERPPDWPSTRYEAKALREGRRSTYFRFRRA